MHSFLESVARRLWPDLRTMPDMQRQFGLLSVFTVLYAVPFVLAGLLWLALRIDLAPLREYPLSLLGVFIAMLLFRRFKQFIYIELVPGVYFNTTSLLDVAVWSATLIFGPVAILLELLATLINAALDWNPADSSDRWSAVQDLLLTSAMLLISRLAALTLYVALGGTLQPGTFSTDTLLPAFAATTLMLALLILLNIPPLIYFARIISATLPAANPGSVVLRGLTLFGFNAIVEVAAIPIAILYTFSGPGVSFFFVAGVLAAAFGGMRLSRSIEQSRQRTREVEQLETLSRSLLTAPPDGSALPDLLHEHIPGMLSYARVAIYLFENDQPLVQIPDVWPGLSPDALRWLSNNPGQHTFSDGVPLPWEDKPSPDNVIIVPVTRADNPDPVGALYAARRPRYGPTVDMLPAAQALAAQVASALHAADLHRERVANERAAKELAIAGDIQATFLPRDLPEVEGWQIAATLQPARETSGDFYDIIPMWDGRVGIVVADVADKGVGAALYMALARTLIRTFATEYATRYPDTYAYHPERVLNTVNQRILEDTSSDQFVTLVYGIIDPDIHTLTYANAGHNPPYLFRTGSGDAPHPLTRTGIPVGMFADQSWERASVKLQPGDVLALYTDGVSEAEDGSGGFFGEDRLIDLIRSHHTETAQSIHTRCLDAIHHFTGSAPQFDDITLMVVRCTQ